MILGFRIGVPSARAELALVVLLAWAAFAAIPLSLGYMGISWDALNHQIYLGWTADASRFGQDVLAATSQTYQYPYLYWPLYKLAAGGFGGVQAALALAAIQVACVPALWMISRACVPEQTWFGAGMRVLSLALAFMSGVVLSLFDSTANDLIAATPLLWAVAVVLPALRERGFRHETLLLATASGLLAGCSVGFKLSNGPLVLLFPVLWACVPGGFRQKTLAVMCGSAAILVGFALAYGAWGWQLWLLHGNPFYPFGDAWLDPVRSWTGWHP